MNEKIIIDLPMQAEHAVKMEIVEAEKVESQQKLASAKSEGQREIEASALRQRDKMQSLQQKIQLLEAQQEQQKCSEENRLQSLVSDRVQVLMAAEKNKWQTQISELQAENASISAELQGARTRADVQLESADAVVALTEQEEVRRALQGDRSCIPMLKSFCGSFLVHLHLASVDFMFTKTRLRCRKCCPEL